jgi:UDP-2,3-diacylglucosamine hydrolase
MSTYFFSDVHLGLGERAAEKEKENRLLEFLTGILPDTTNLVILGDLFDFWFEYRTVIPKGFHRTLTAIQSFTDRGVPVYYMAGNHDFWMGDFFSRELGVTMHADPADIRIDGRLVHLHHGDGLAKNDLGYRLIKPILRNRFNIALYRWLHPDLGVPLARGSSRTSRDYTSNKDYGNEEEGMIRYATEKISTGADIVVMGHRHKPSLQPIGKGTYVNLGDWITYHSYGVLKEGAITLQTWNGQQGQHHA